MNASQVRAKLIEFLRRDLIGPAHGDLEEIDQRPSQRYSAGVLFPPQTIVNESEEVGGVVSTEEVLGGDEEIIEGMQGSTARVDPETGAEDSDFDDTMTLANAYKPSAMALSFLCEIPDGDSLLIDISAATYTTVRKLIDGRDRTEWARHPLKLEPVVVVLDSEKPLDTRKHPVAPGLFVQSVVRRQAPATYLCTVTLVNGGPGGKDAPSEFCQAAFRISSRLGNPVFVEYSPNSRAARDAEERVLAMLYRNRRIFAVGHGCAASWNAVSDERASSVETSSLPWVRVPPVLPTSDDVPGLSMEVLAAEGEGDPDEVPGILTEFLREYEEWIESKTADPVAVSSEFVEEALQQLDTCRDALGRMRQGVRVLEANAWALRAFTMMNRAMLRQQAHVSRRRKVSDPWEPLPTHYESSWSEKRGYWRKFQIAFILMTLPAFVDPGDDEEARSEFDKARNLVDLIWFPTGGGKTEAYLGVAAFAIFMRRRRNPADSGCSVLMRYTLRLLTSQQFQRAASLICACELMRRDAPEELGETPISIGLWVGQSLTPNKERAAKTDVNKLAGRSRGAPSGFVKNPFQLLNCPWCGTQLDDRDNLGYVMHGKRMIFRCPASGGAQSHEPCPFSTTDAPLPVCVVDETLYKAPPTLLLGTVDKFALLAWRPQAGVFFGRNDNDPPDLVIQDELHLISGPLGSIVGLYESFIDYLCRDDQGRTPKIVASTATIRRAAKQCKDLFNRDSFQFPPAGVDASDTYFAREYDDAAGRLYVGLLPTAASSPLTAQIRAVSALAQGLLIVTNDTVSESCLDPYWTLIQYFSSLKELGRAATLVSSDIPEYLPSMQRRYELADGDRRSIWRSEELTSRKNETEIAQILRKLEVRYEREPESYERALDTLLATNMISVGVDVKRLGLMMVVTQPKSTSEYIQASSRVGRSASAPGLVLTAYNASRSRDRSHYEQFRGYHESFYRFVEPTSVTPFSLPALERALHAGLVILARQVGGVARPRDFRPGGSLLPGRDELSPSSRRGHRSRSSRCVRRDPRTPREGVMQLEQKRVGRVQRT